MKLFELAYACRIYREIARFDEAYCVVRQSLGDECDLTSEAQLNALLTFLNRWGCRIPKENFGALGDKLRNWASEWVPRLPTGQADICHIDESLRQTIENSYEALLETGNGLNLQEVAAAKTLHALRPKALPIWDNNIKNWFINQGNLGQRSSRLYSLFILHIQNEIRELEEDLSRGARSCSLGDLRALVRRDQSSLVKMIDEYYWVTVAQGYAIPTRNELDLWTSWLQ